jgi:hypothetical protein
MSDVLIEKGWFVQGLQTGKGVVVIRPGYVAFVPVEEIKHLGATIAKGVALAAAGFVEVKGKNKRALPIKQWLEEALGEGFGDRAGSETSDEEIDDRVESLLEPTGGMMWSPPQAKVWVKRIPLRRKKALWFVFGDRTMRLARALGKEELAEAEALLEEWPRKVAG